VKSLFASLRKNRRLLRDLVSRDLRARYVGSSMGFFWSVIFPILNLVVYMFVFSFVLKMRWTEAPGSHEVALIMLSGIIVWQAFAETVSRTTNTLVENQNLIQKVVFPSEVLPVYLVLSALVNMLIGVGIAVLAVVWLAYVAPPEAAAGPSSAHGALPLRELGVGWSLCALPLLLLLQALFTLGLGYLLAALNLFVRDVYHVIGVALSIWMFMTPIFYPARMVQDAGLAWVLQVNPMYWLIESYRRVLIWGEWPGLPVLGAFAAVALLAFALGTWFFIAQKPRFPDLL
jgi:ABC-type polysaccharide/polyol phosphate export permease